MKRNFVDYFQWLEVHFTASDEVVKAAYRKLSHKYHPDNNGDQWQLLRVNEAYEVLSDPEKRKAYLKQYAGHFGNGQLLTDGTMNHSMFDYTVAPIRRGLLEYLFFIKNGELETAYRQLSRYNRKHLFKKDFIEWQRLIGTIHEMKAFDCTFVESGVIQFSEDRFLRNRKYMKFKVKVTTHNHLMGKVEEDTFDRLMVLDEEGWNILLRQQKLKSVIKKYRKLTEVYKKNQHPLSVERRGTDFLYGTGYVNRKTFLNNCEHEQLRFVRYKAPYTVLGFELASSDTQAGKIRELFEHNLRILDSVTYLKRGVFLVLLPETGGEDGEMVREKLLNLLGSAGCGDGLKRSVCKEQVFDSVKALLAEVTGV